ncbi:MAG: dockerin type I domain-containing protein [Ruminococcus sp.]|nr:dockerin type I domain-containing protein [Ruminococcus sp.]
MKLRKILAAAMAMAMVSGTGTFAGGESVAVQAYSSPLFNSASKTLDESDISSVELSIAQLPEQTKYLLNSGNYVDVTDMKVNVTINYADGTSEDRLVEVYGDVGNTIIAIDGLDTSKLGKQTLTVECCLVDDFGATLATSNKATFEIEVIEKEEVLTVTSSEATVNFKSMPEKTVFNVGEKLDLTGCAFTVNAAVHFSDETVAGISGLEFYIDQTFLRPQNAFSIAHKSNMLIKPFEVIVDTKDVDNTKAGTYNVHVKVTGVPSSDVVKEENIEITYVDEVVTTTTTETTTTTTTTTEATTTEATTTTAETTTEATTTEATTTTAPETTTEPVTTTVTTPAKEVSFGDPTGDGKIDANDASFVLVEYAKVSTGGESALTPEEVAAADVNGDGKVDAKDASAILAYYSYLSTGGDKSLRDYLIK